MALSMKDLITVLNELSDAKPKWHNLGLELKLDNSILESIRKEYREDIDDCFRETIVAWFKSSSSEVPKTWSTLADALKAPIVGFGYLATQIKEKYCQQPQAQAGEKRPHPNSDESESDPKRPCLNKGCNCEELKKLLQANDQCIQEQDIRLNHLEISIRALVEDNNNLKKENAKLKSQCSELERQAKQHSGIEKQVKEHSEQLQKLMTQTSKVTESASKPTPTKTSEVDNNILWMRRALHNVRDDWYEFGCEFEVGLNFLDDIKSKHSDDSKHCLFLVLREWLTQLEAEGDTECKTCKLIEILRSPLLEHYDIAETLDGIWHSGCRWRGQPNEYYGRFWPFQ